MFYEQEYQHYLESIGLLPSTRRVHRYTLEHFKAHL